MTISMQKPDLTPGERNRIFQVMLDRSVGGKVIKGIIPDLASQYGVSVRTIQKIWSSSRATLSRDQAVIFVSNKKGKPGKQRVFLDVEKFTNLEPPHKKSVRKVAKELGVSKSLVWLWKKNKVIVPHTNAVKPILTDKNNLERMQYCLSFIYYDEDDKVYKFVDMMNIIHIDEKFFYMKEEVERYYDLPDHVPELRTTQNKRFITKIMFLCAVCRPHLLAPQVFSFDGKIGCWPLTEMVPAQRRSINRERGTLEQKAIKAITKVVTKDFMLNKVIPAIKEKWPATASKRILIQWDNAPPHIKNSDPDIRAACSSDGFDIQLFFQPPNSPDCNVNDLGWFRCLETVQWETRSYSVENLCAIVAESFDKVEADKLNRVYLSLQQGMIEILKAKGSNGFKQPHMGKDQLIRLGILPTTLEIDEELVRESVEYVVENWDGTVPNYDFSQLMSHLGYCNDDDDSNDI